MPYYFYIYLLQIILTNRMYISIIVLVTPTTLQKQISTCYISYSKYGYKMSFDFRFSDIQVGPQE